MTEVALRSIWEPLTPNSKRGGPARSRIYVSHWRNPRHDLLVAFRVADDGTKRTRLSIHPDVLRREYRLASTAVGSVYPKS